MNKIFQGDSLEILKTLKSESVNCVMTSPPYWALRDYGIKEQLGLEPTFEEYVTKLCNIFDEVKRVLRKDGTCWVNIGDTYGGSGKGVGGKNPKESWTFKNKPKENGIDKCLCMIPFRFAIEMVNRGWILRNTIIWHKPNAMPSSVKDRFTVDFEYLFFFVKSKKYYFQSQYEPHLWASRDNRSKIKGGVESQGKSASKTYAIKRVSYGEHGRNKRTVWKISTKPMKEAHFATYPEKLCEIPIKSGCPTLGVVLDPFFGAGTTGLAALKLMRKFIGIEINPNYIEIAKNRLKPFLEQTKLISIENEM